MASNQFQQKLATYVVLVGTVMCGLCAITAIVAVAWDEGGDKVADASKQILSILLPVIGTWVGTVLAFYFGRENFEAGARETRLSLGQRLSDPVMKDAIPIAKIKHLAVADDAAAKAMLLSKIDDYLKREGFFRVPILTDKKVALYVVHRQPLDSFLVEAARAAAAKKQPVDLAALTLNDLLVSTQGANVTGSFMTVGEKATLAEAKSAMESRKDCQDVFVTPTGRPDEPIVAWLTNNEIQRAASA